MDKETAAKKAVEGIPHEIAVSGALLVMPEVSSIERSGDLLTITRKRFFDTTENALTVTLVACGVADVGNVAVKNLQRTPTKITMDLAPLKLTPACWTPSVTVGR